ncbi:hypothetical protein LAWI1_G007389, partial [Lachnellula willkommii]
MDFRTAKPRFGQACGNSEFSSLIRAMVLKAMDEYQDVEFAEIEFQPCGVRKVYLGIYGFTKDDIEMDAKLIVRQAGRRRRLVRLSRLGHTESASAVDLEGNKDDKKRLIRAHSGVIARLKTLDEEDELGETLGARAK